MTHGSRSRFRSLQLSTTVLIWPVESDWIQVRSPRCYSQLCALKQRLSHWSGVLRFLLGKMLRASSAWVTSHGFYEDAMRYWIGKQSVNQAVLYNQRGLLFSTLIQGTCRSAGPVRMICPSLLHIVERTVTAEKASSRSLVRQTLQAGSPELWMSL